MRGAGHAQSYHHDRTNQEQNFTRQGKARKLAVRGALQAP
jgi:hypothetical protein